MRLFRCSKTGKRRPRAEVDVVVVAPIRDTHTRTRTHNIHEIIKYLCHVSFYALILFK